MTTAKPRAFWLSQIQGSAERALRDQTPACLLAYSFELAQDTALLRLKAHFEGLPSTEDLETMLVVETEVFSDFVDEFETRTEFELVMTGQEPLLLHDGVPYQRRATAEQA